MLEERSVTKAMFALEQGNVFDLAELLRLDCINKQDHIRKAA